MFRARLGLEAWAWARLWAAQAPYFPGPSPSPLQAEPTPKPGLRPGLVISSQANELNLGGDTISHLSGVCRGTASADPLQGSAGPGNPEARALSPVEPDSGLGSALSSPGSGLSGSRAQAEP
ncbi:hypothetical protein FB45DRAFT_868165 [Roridomyces roridus]|uniref:Uncharacterized protein n=1 Tax=Roridomyces roridus TaxID=1738132 RepID=A0AAD7BPA2_9AGAR|nr:hypothetical protein FB45DRAFT_868165 [Roridomyces roridus]